jgi:hypothetical protein
MSSTDVDDLQKDGCDDLQDYLVWTEASRADIPADYIETLLYFTTHQPTI